MDTLDLEGRLGEYLQQLALLEQEDIRIPNQSLILDFFCIDEQFSEFLRQDIFRPVDFRNKTWALVNIRAAETNEIIKLEHLETLLEYKGQSSEKIWKRIVYCTAEHQKNIKTLELIDDITTNSSPIHNQKSSLELESSVGPNSDSIPSEKESNSNLDISAQLPTISDERLLKDNNIVNKEPNFLGILIGSLSAVLMISAILTTSLSNSNTEVGVQQPSSSSDDTDGLVKLEHDSKDAVLICELRPIIERANSLSLSEESTIARKNKLVSEINKSIAYLDQESGSGHKYWEDSSCTWGVQWFDKHTDTAFRAFIAVSKKCVAPVVHYGYTKTKDPSDNVFIRKGQVNLGKFEKGEVSLPYLDADGFGMIDKVLCGG